MFLLDAEKSHGLAIKFSALIRLPIIKQVVQLISSVNDKSISSEVFGIKFPNPVGIAAGVDKDCEILDVFKILDLAG